MWVKSRVRLVAEQILRIKHNGASYGYTLLHTT